MAFTLTVIALVGFMPARKVKAQGMPLPLPQLQYAETTTARSLTGNPSITLYRVREAPPCEPEMYEVATKSEVFEQEADDNDEGEKNPRQDEDGKKGKHGRKNHHDNGGDHKHHPHRVVLKGLRKVGNGDARTTARYIQWLSRQEHLNTNIQSFGLTGAFPEGLAAIMTLGNTSNERIDPFYGSLDGGTRFVRGVPFANENLLIAFPPSALRHGITGVRTFLGLCYDKGTKVQKHLGPIKVGQTNPTTRQWLPYSVIIDEAIDEETGERLDIQNMPRAELLARCHGFRSTRSHIEGQTPTTQEFRGEDAGGQRGEAHVEDRDEDRDAQRRRDGQAARAGGARPGTVRTPQDRQAASQEAEIRILDERRQPVTSSVRATFYAVNENGEAKTLQKDVTGSKVVNPPSAPWYGAVVNEPGFNLDKEDGDTTQEIDGVAVTLRPAQSGKRLVFTFVRGGAAPAAERRETPPLGLPRVAPVGAPRPAMPAQQMRVRVYARATAESPKAPCFVAWQSEGKRCLPYGNAGGRIGDQDGVLILHNVPGQNRVDGGAVIRKGVAMYTIECVIDAAPGSKVELLVNQHSGAFLWIPIGEPTMENGVLTWELVRSDADHSGR